MLKWWLILGAMVTLLLANSACQEQPIELAPMVGAVTSSSAQEQPIELAPMVGAVTSSSAQVWFRVSSEGNAVQVGYGEHPDLSDETVSPQTVIPGLEDDYTCLIELENLSANTIYYYRIILNGEAVQSDSFPSFKTFPETTTSARIGVLADSAFHWFNSSPALQALADDEPDLVLVLGDWPHQGPIRLDRMRLMHRRFRERRMGTAGQFVDHILLKYPVAYVWDDHDYGGNDTDKTFAGKSEALQAYDEYWPCYDRPNPEAGIWHRFKYGDFIEVFMLDLRSQRDPDSYQDPRYIPDHMPGANRDELRYDPGRSILDGDESDGDPKGQKQWLKDGLLTSTAQWKIIASSVPWNPTVQKDDAWWDFMAEQEELMQFIVTNGIGGIIVVSGDIHTGGAIDDGTYAGLPEISVPPSTMNSLPRTCYLRRPARFSGCGNWSHGGPIPVGTGYGLITLTDNAAVIEAKDKGGATLLDLSLFQE
jgi:alkaline phosphatase D